MGDGTGRRGGALLIGALLIAAAIAAVLWLVPPLSEGCCAPPPDSSAPASDPRVPVRQDDAFALTVNHVYDGDTIRATVLSPNEVVPTTDPIRIRLIGIDTPEGTPTVECWADEARAHLAALLPERSTVWAVADREPLDRYERYLFYLWTDDGDFVNHVLVASGDAEAIRVGRNDAHYELLAAAQTEAEAAGLGRWGACG